MDHTARLVAPSTPLMMERQWIVQPERCIVPASRTGMREWNVTSPVSAHAVDQYLQARDRSLASRGWITPLAKWYLPSSLVMVRRWVVLPEQGIVPTPRDRYTGVERRTSLFSY